MKRVNTKPTGKIRTRLPAYSPAVDQDVDRLKDLPPARIFTPEDTLIDRGDTPAYVGLVQSGIIKLSFIDDDGREVNLGLRSKGWWLNAQSALLNLPSVFRATPVDECSISLVPASEFAAFLFGHSELLRHFLLSQSRELASAQQQAVLRAGSAEERLHYFLGESGSSVWATEDMAERLRKRDIADLLGITPEHLSRLRTRTVKGVQVKRPNG